jgi:transposase
VSSASFVAELIAGGGPRELSTKRAKALLSEVTPQGSAEQMRVDLACEHITDIERIELRLDEITAQVTVMVKDSGTTLCRIFGIGFLSAAVVLAEVGEVARFPSRDHLASYAGTAPIDVSSGEQQRHRLNRAGNRQLNSAMHVAAIVQIRHDTPGRAYYRRKLAAGKTKREALRCLKRRITDAVWRQLQIDAQLDPEPQDDSWPRWKSTRGNSPKYLSPATLRANGRPRQPKSIGV